MARKRRPVKLGTNDKQTQAAERAPKANIAGRVVFGFSQSFTQTFLAGAVAATVYAVVLGHVHQGIFATLAGVLAGGIVFAPLSWLSMPPAKDRNATGTKRINVSRSLRISFLQMIGGLTEGTLMGWAAAVLSPSQVSLVSAGICFLLLIYAGQSWMRAYPKTDSDIKALALTVFTAIGVLVVPTSLPIAVAYALNAQWPQWLNNLNTVLGIVGGIVGIVGYLEMRGRLSERSNELKGNVSRRRRYRR